MAFCRARLVFGDDSDSDTEESSPISSKNGSVDSDRPTEKTPFKIGLNSRLESPVNFEFGAATPHACKLDGSMDAHGDSGISSPFPSEVSGRIIIQPAPLMETPPSFRTAVQLKYDDSGDEDPGSPVRIESPARNLQPHPNQLEAVQAMDRFASSPAPVTPPSKRLRSLCLYDTPHTPKSLVEKAQRRISHSRTSNSFKGSRDSSMNRSLLDPEGPQANTNPFTPETNSPSLNLSLELQKSRSSGKGLKRTRKATLDPSADVDLDAPVAKKIALREINTSRYNEEFFEIEKLGDGEFGSVFKCIHRLDGCPYAIKKSKMPVAGSAYERSAMNEVYAHAVLGKHQHVVRYYSAWAENDHMYIQNEFCNGASLAVDLQERKEKGREMNETELKTLLLQLADGLRYIHSQHLVHLDIKPGNVFIHKCRASESGIEEDLLADEESDCYKIGDLGHVTSIQHPEVEEGDVRYLPHEILQEDFDDLHLQKADIFSLSLTVYEAASNCELPKNGPAWHRIRTGRLPALANISSDFHKLLLSMIHPEPSQRPSALDLLHNPIIRPADDLSKAQLQRQLNETKFQNQMLARQVEELKKQTPAVGPPAAKSSGSRLLGKKANGKKVNRSLSVTCF